MARLARATIDWGGLLAIFAIVVTTAQPRAQLFVPTGRDTLRGLPGVEVLVEPLQPQLDRAGLSSAAFAADVSAQLRTAGIKVFANQRENPSQAKPYVYLHINVASVPRSGGYAVGIQLHLRQTLGSLVTESRVVNAMSWDAHNVIVASPAMLRDEIGIEVRALVRTFIEDWKSVHPEP
jgi:hypothetical protein